MNGDIKKSNQNLASDAQDDQKQPQAQVAPIVPAGSVNKETVPVGIVDAEFVKSSETEPQVSQELKESGVEIKSDRPDLTFEHKELGVNHAGPIPVSSSSPSHIILPMSEEEMTDKLKTGQDDDSGKWLAGLLKKIIAMMGL